MASLQQHLASLLRKKKPKKNIKSCENANSKTMLIADLTAKSRFTFLMSSDSGFLLVAHALTSPFQGVGHKAVPRRGGEAVERLIVEPVTSHLLYGPGKTFTDRSVAGKCMS